MIGGEHVNVIAGGKAEIEDSGLMSLGTNSSQILLDPPFDPVEGLDRVPVGR